MHLCDGVARKMQCDSNLYMLRSEFCPVDSRHVFHDCDSAMLRWHHAPEQRSSEV